MRLMRRLRRYVEQEFGSARFSEASFTGPEDYLDRAVFVLFDDGVRVGELLFRLNKMTGLVPAYQGFVGAARTPEVIRKDGLATALAPHLPTGAGAAPLALPLSWPLMHVFGVDASARYAQPIPVAMKLIAEQRRPMVHVIDSDLPCVAMTSLAQDLGILEKDTAFRLEPSVVARRIRNHEWRGAAMERMIEDLDVRVEQIDLAALRSEDWREEMRRALIAVSLYAEIAPDAVPLSTGAKLLSRVINRDEIRAELRRLRRARA